MLDDQGRFLDVTPQASRFIFALLASGLNREAAARRFGVTRRQVQRICAKPHVKCIVQAIQLRLQEKLADAAGNYIATRTQVLQRVTHELFSPNPEMRLLAARLLLRHLPQESPVERSEISALALSRLPWERQIELLEQESTDSSMCRQDVLEPELLVLGEELDLNAIALGLKAEVEEWVDFDADDESTCP